MVVVSFQLFVVFFRGTLNARGHMPALLEGIIRSRFARLALSVALLGVGAWAFFPHLMSRVAPFGLCQRRADASIGADFRKTIRRYAANGHVF